MGPYFAGWIAHMCLAGLLWSSLSAYLETELFRQDPPSTKLLLLLVFLTDLVSVGLTGEELFHCALAFSV